MFQVVAALVAHGHSVSVGLCQGYSAVLLPQLSSPDSDLGVISGEAASWLGERFKRSAPQVSQTSLCVHLKTGWSESCYMVSLIISQLYFFPTCQLFINIDAKIFIQKWIRSSQKNHQLYNMTPDPL